MDSEDSRKERGISAQRWSEPSSENSSLFPLNIDGARSTKVKCFKRNEINLCLLLLMKSLLFLPTNSLGPPHHCPAPCATAVCLAAAGTCARCLLLFPSCSSQPVATALVLFNGLKCSKRTCTIQSHVHVNNKSLITRPLTSSHFSKHTTLNACSTPKAHPHSTTPF